MQDICKAFSMKLWWKFRTDDSLWSRYMFHKCCSKIHPIECVKGVGGSYTWHRMVESTDLTESSMVWIISKGNVNFWKDRWFNDQKLGKGVNIPYILQNLIVKEALVYNLRRKVCWPIM